ncbi:hypothetical protein TRFO_03750 [Tritrichomonas foetus]|uniref:EamA domain-containing protein n=1 Tax=Tritrichomonas foetus TaxID=1144522 RepID=A0A1J4KQP7_9EUKA|nr:hypothetical protein TRFO_03750 [Tritrichomonas foetus]|eukprot:OHT12116.1 hypothetical protein TRFO_03750 [Tritrichomonas foetus]
MGVLANVGLATAFLGTGSLNTITNKILYQTQGVNIGGDIQYFDRPWLNTFIMFLGELLCLIVYGIIALIMLHIPPKVDDDSDSNLTIEEKAAKKAEKNRYAFITRDEVMRNPTGGLGWKYPLYVTLFGACDLGGTTLMGIGLTFCNASIIQIVRGFVIVFTMLFAWPILHRKPNPHQLLGVMFSVIGLIVVGVSAVLNNGAGSVGSKENTIGNTILGIGLTLVGQLFSATQFVLEEKLLKQDNGEVAPIPPLFLVGSEGLAGTILCAAIALPVVNAIPGNDFGSYENMKNSFYMLFHNKFLLGIQFLAFMSIAFFNWCGFVYSKALSATSRTLVDALRTIIVWIVMVGVYYGTKAKYGEPISIWSILQAGGFVFMLLGTITHNNIAGVGRKFTKCCKYPQTENEKELYDSKEGSDSLSSNSDENEEVISLDDESSSTSISGSSSTTISEP